jgi:hypothetical protein
MQSVDRAAVPDDKRQSLDFSPRNTESIHGMVAQGGSEDKRNQ